MKKLIITYYIKRSLHITLMSSNHYILMFFSTTLHSLLNTAIYSIYVAHMKCLQNQVKTFETTFLIDIKLTFISVALRQLFMRLIMLNTLYKTSLSFLNHHFMTIQQSKQPYFNLMSHQKLFTQILKALLSLLIDFQLISLRLNAYFLLQQKTFSKSKY